MLELKKYLKNEKGRDFVVGDIHGSIDLLFKHLNSIGFDYEKDRLFSVGDLVNRGNKSFDMVLLAADVDWFYPVLGNHEIMLILYYLYGYYKDELKKRNGQWFLNSQKNFQKGIYEILIELPMAIELEYPEKNIGIVHSGVPYNNWKILERPITTFTDKVVDLTLWDRDRYYRINTDYITGIDYVFVGHTIVSTPVQLENMFFIDTGACYSGIMTTINIEDFLKNPKF